MVDRRALWVCVISYRAIVASNQRDDGMLSSLLAHDDSTAPSTIWMQEATTLEQAIDTWDTRQLIRLIGQGADVNRPVSEAGSCIRAIYGDNCRVSADERGGITPLIRAAYRGNIEAVKQLIQHKAVIDYQDEQGLSPLVAAALGTTQRHKDSRAQHLDVITLLLEKGSPLPDEPQLRLLEEASQQEALIYAHSEDLHEPGGSKDNGIYICYGEAACNHACFLRAVKLLDQFSGKALSNFEHKSFLQRLCVAL